MIIIENHIDKIEVLSSGHIQIREIVRAIEDGNVKSESFSRRVIEPNSDLTGESEKVVGIANIVW